MNDNDLAMMRVVDAARAVMWSDGHISTSDQLNSDTIIRMYKAMQAANDRQEEDYIPPHHGTPVPA